MLLVTFRSKCYVIDVVGIAEKNSGHQRSANVSQMQQYVSQINGKSMHYGSSVAPNQMGSKTSVPRFKETSEEQRTDRFIRLQNFIKQCDGSNHRENIQCMFFADFLLIIILIIIF